VASGASTSNPEGSKFKRADRGLKPKSGSCGPQVLVCLGATAAQALLGKRFRLNTQRGPLVYSELAPYATATVHPSSILRAPDDAARQAQMAAFVKDLKKVAKLLRSKQDS
jgi:DNA polymerase